MLKKLFILVVFGGLLLVQNFALAAGPLGKATDNLGNALKNTGLESNLELSIGTVVNGLLSLVGTIFLVLTVWAGIMWMTAQGNEEKVAKAKSIVTQATIGLVLVMAAYAITAFVTGKLGGTTENTSANCAGTCEAVCGASVITETSAPDCTGTANLCCIY